MTEHEGETDILPPNVVLAELAAHDKRVEQRRAAWAMVKASLKTRYWRHIRGLLEAESGKPGSGSTRWDLDHIETNRLAPAIAGYLATLYPRAIQPLVQALPSTEGDASKAELLQREWLATGLNKERILHCTRLTLTYGMGAGKVGYDAGDQPAIDRTWLRICPPWEVVLDEETLDIDDQRFIGHVGYYPLRDVERDYNLEGLKGCDRVSFLDNGSGATKRGKADRGAEDDGTGGQFVRVLEFCNLVDGYEADGLRYEGRLEVYVLGQRAEISRKPVHVGPLPLEGANGKPMAHIVPLIFDHDGEHPLQGLAYADRMMPQIHEINSGRSAASQAGRRDARIYVTRTNSMTADEATALTLGEDGTIIRVDEDTRDLNDIVVPIRPAPLSGNMQLSMQMAESDLERAHTRGPSALGVITKATAYEVSAVEAHTESEYGRHAEQRDRWLAAILERMLAAARAAMVDVEGSAGESGESDFGFDLDKLEKDLDATEDEATDEAAEPAEDEAEDDLEESTEEAQGDDDDTDDDAEEDEEGEEDEDKEPAKPAPELRVRPILLLDDNEDEVIIVPDDIIGPFAIGFTDTGRTPNADAELKQVLAGPMLDKYLAMFQTLAKGGPDSIFARAAMTSIATHFGFPPNLHPDALLRELRQQENEASEKAAKAPKQADPPGAGPDAAPSSGPDAAPPGGPGGPGEAPPPGGGGGAEQLLQMPPEEALQALADAFPDNPEIQQFIKQVQGLPPDQQQAAIAGLVQQMQGGAGAGAPAAPQGPPPQGA